MSKPHLEKLLKQELVVVNDLIDRKIIRGTSYSKEARRHKFITARLSQLKRHSQVSWLTRFGFRSAIFS